MIKVSSIIDDKGARSFLIDIGDRVADMRALNQVLGERFVEELQAHWRVKDQKPNKLGGKRTHFWSKAAAAVAVADVSESGVTVAVQGEAGQNIRIHVHGGTIKPKAAKALTIPIIREAHGMRAAEYEQQYGTELFTIRGKKALFEKTGRGSATNATEGRRRGNTIPIQRDEKIRAVFALATEAKIPADPTALPDEATLLAALQEEAEDWFDAIGEGGAS